MFVTLRSNRVSLLAGSYINHDMIQTDFQDKIKTFHREILDKNIFHLCKYNIIKLNQIITHKELIYTGICQDSDPLCNSFCRIEVRSLQKRTCSSSALIVPLALAMNDFLPPLRSENYRTHIFLCSYKLFHKWISLTGH